MLYNERSMSLFTQALLLNLANEYIEDVRLKAKVSSKDIAEPVLLPDKGIWHPVADKVFEDADEYFKWYNSVHAPNAGIKPNAPVIGLILQKSHINTKDECHYIAMVAELEARGAKVITLYRYE